MATNRPETITPSSRAPSAAKPVRLAGNRGDHEIDDDRRQHRKQRRDDHLADRGLGDEVDGAAHNSGRTVPSMIPGLSRNCARTSSTTAPAGAADRGHAHRAEAVGQQRAEQQADDDVGVGQAEKSTRHADRRRIREGRSV